ncbi:MAG: DUF2290 domain-containing protein [Ruminococcus flavefaciens]|nr:DUF2290 domain-containing protein [Ruminococcus flavefaciens]
MKAAKILTSIEEVLKYLDAVEISYDTTDKRKNLQPHKYSDAYYQTFHDGDYKKTFIIASENRDFDIMLEDGSLFQFTSRNENDIHYSFLHRIEKNMSFDEFYNLYATDENIDTIEQDYEYYLSGDKEELYTCPIRYDVAENEYIKMHHAYAHLHIGIETDIRIPVDKILSPMHFVDFVIKHMYKTQWDNAYTHNDKFKERINSLKTQAENIDDDYFTQDEKNLLYIN